MKIRAGAFSFEASNPRHEHEWSVWKSAKLPEGTILIPGVITHSIVLVEHPELVAQRIVRYADFMGRENVIAGTDCGFATFAGSDEVHAEHRLGEVRGAREGRANRKQAAVGPRLTCRSGGRLQGLAGYLGAIAGRDRPRRGA